ncbi:hypothetical protein [Tumebacillus flagellatus]|uniref:Uncharacterized protein n=1 Tax=Tumebacillus flagellatus TaxID=1157490 RepID=A0A074LHG1_9BACL|nr:hypothetical protein [Tumebacillus flagellatus]KEO81641.1 hypothetical protein EL26_19405 [Tumebacillus flagellatus]
MSRHEIWEPPPPYLHDVFVDGVKVCKVLAVNKAHAQYMAQYSSEFLEAVRLKKTYTVTIRQSDD